MAGQQEGFLEVCTSTCSTMGMLDNGVLGQDGTAVIAEQHL